MCFTFGMLERGISGNDAPVFRISSSMDDTGGLKLAQA